MLKYDNQTNNAKLLCTSKTSYMFRPPFVAILKEVLYEGYVTNNSQKCIDIKYEFLIYGLKHVKMHCR